MRSTLDQRERMRKHARLLRRGCPRQGSQYKERNLKNHREREYLESNMRASGISWKTRKDPPDRREYAYRRREKEPEVSTSGQDPMTLEEVTKLLKTMANDLTKVKQGKAAHSFVGPAPRAKNKPLRGQPQFRRPPNVLQRETRQEEPELSQTSRVQANMIVSSPPYYEEYYEQRGEEPVDQPMDLNMLFHPGDSETGAKDSFSLESESLLMMGEEEGLQEEEIFLQGEDSFNLSPAQLQMVSENIMAEVRRKYELRPRLNSSNFRREEASRHPENARKEVPKATKIPRREAQSC